MGKETFISILPLSTDNKREARGGLRKSFLVDKLNNPLGYILLFLACAGRATCVGLFGLKFGVLAIVIMVAVPALYALVAYPVIGMTVFMVMAYFLLYILKLGVNFPLGTAMDGMDGLFILGLLIQQRKKKDWSIFRGPVSTMVLIWIGYNVLEVANPTAESRMAWVYTIRTVAVIAIMYFVFLYNIRTKEVIRFMLKLWLGLALFAAIYAFKQQYVGFTSFEQAYLDSDPEVAELLFIGGVWRKFSIFSDPVVFAYTMVVSSLLCVGILTGPVSPRKKWMLRGLIFIYIDAMLFSGTRGAYVLMPVSMILYAILKYNRKVLMAAIIGAVIFVALIFIPTSNNTLYRFQSAFKPSNDASYNLRKNNQKKIQPYILTHPMGGGLGATGLWGLKFSPGSYLAHFPPDSGYVRVAVENGWIGLLLLCLLMFTVLKTGINNYYLIKDPELKSYCLGFILVIFAFHIGNFPQEALVQYPSNVNFYLTIALIGVVMRIDQQQNKLLNGAG
jgi:putative inorganic carbon (HCO3(-)) transporter